MKKTILALAVALSSLGCAAVTFPFNVTAPTWNKVAECTTEGGVNIRKAPSTTAPKLVYNEVKLEQYGYDTPLKYIAYWGSKTGGNISPVKFEGPAAIVSERLGWIELLGEGPNAKSNAWVSSKYCKITETTPIKANGNPSSPKILFFNIDNVTYAIYLVDDDMNSEAKFYIGRLVDGKIVCPYAFECQYREDIDNETDPSSIKKDELFGSYYYNATKNGMSEISGFDGTYYTPDVSKIPTNTLDFIIKQAKAIDWTLIVYLNEGKYNTMSLE